MNYLQHLLKLLYDPTKSAVATKGFLLPTTIALGIGISAVSVIALTTVSQNGTTLNQQYFDSVAQEAAQAGIAAAAACIRAGDTSWSTDGITSTVLTPATGCDGKAIIGKGSSVINNSEIETTYSVGSLNTSLSTTMTVVTSTGEVRIKGPGNEYIGLTKKVIKTLAKTSDSSGRISRTATQISAGTNSTCTVAQSWVYCWGDNTYSQIGSGASYSGNFTSLPKAVSSSSAMSGQSVTSVSVGFRHTCAVASGKAYCWGDNSRGELGNNSHTNSGVPVAVDTSLTGYPSQSGLPATGASALAGKKVVDVQAGQYFSCALTSDGIVACWGANDYGQLGDNSRTDSNVPVAVDKSAGSSVVPASALNSHTVKRLAQFNNNQHVCVIRDDDNAVCWGRNYAGQTGNDSVPPASSNLTITKAYDALKPVSVYTGDATGSRPASALQGKTIKSLAVFQGYTTAIASDNRTYWWGGWSGNSSIVIAQNERTYASVGRPVGPLYTGTYTYTLGGFYGERMNANECSPLISSCSTWTTFLDNKSIQLMSGSAQEGVFCALSGQDLYCDGSHYGSDDFNAVRAFPVDYGQLGDGSTICSITTIASCNAGKKSGINTSNLPPGPVHVYQNGILLNKTISALTSSDPNVVGGDNNDPTATASGGSFSCVIAAKTVYCWGKNDKGQLGDGTTTSRNIPTAVNIATGSDLGISAESAGYGQFDNPVNF